MFGFATGKESEWMGVICKFFPVLDPVRKREKKMDINSGDVMSPTLGTQ